MPVPFSEFHHEGAPHVHWRRAFFDGQFIYLVEGNSADRYEFPERPVHLKTLDLERKVVATTDYKSPEVVPPGRGNGAFIRGVSVEVTLLQAAGAQDDHQDRVEGGAGGLALYG